MYLYVSGEVTTYTGPEREVRGGGRGSGDLVPKMNRGGASVPAGRWLDVGIPLLVMLRKTYDRSECQFWRGCCLGGTSTARGRHLIRAHANVSNGRVEAAY